MSLVRRRRGRTWLTDGQRERMMPVCRSRRVVYFSGSALGAFLLENTPARLDRNRLKPVGGRTDLRCTWLLYAGASPTRTRQIQMRNQAGSVPEPAEQVFRSIDVRFNGCRPPSGAAAHAECRRFGKLPACAAAGARHTPRRDRGQPPRRSGRSAVTCECCRPYARPAARACVLPARTHGDQFLFAGFASGRFVAGFRGSRDPNGFASRRSTPPPAANAATRTPYARLRPQTRCPPRRAVTSSFSRVSPPAGLWLGPCRSVAGFRGFRVPDGFASLRSTPPLAADAATRLATAATRARAIRPGARHSRDRGQTPRHVRGDRDVLVAVACSANAVAPTRDPPRTHERPTHWLSD